MRCVIDANILIDLSQGGVLPYLFRLPIQVAAPAVVLDEMIEPDREALLAMGVERMDLTADQLLETMQMNTADARLSLGDCAAFIAARDEDVTLLTGDRRLRGLAGDVGLTVHGVLWLLDAIEAVGWLTGPELAASLKKMLDGGAHLPAHECSERLRKWEHG